MRRSLRSLIRTPAFTLTALLSLALGIGANTAIFTLVHHLLIRSLPYPDADRIFALWQHNPSRGLDRDNVTPANYADWKTRAQSFEHLAYTQGWAVNDLVALAGDPPERIRSEHVPASFFCVFGVAPVLGRVFRAEEDQQRELHPGTAILGHALWQRRFGGDRAVLGKSLTIDSYGRKTYAIVGVMPPGFDFPDRNELWLPQGYLDLGIPPPNSGNRCCAYLKVYGRLRPGVLPFQAENELNRIAAALAAEHPVAQYGSSVVMVPLREQLAGSLRDALRILYCAVTLVLLIACANVANLGLARAWTRRKEFHVRAALGAGRWRLLAQPLAESFALSAAGAGLGVLLAAWAVAYANSQLNLPAPVSLDAPVLAFTTALAALTAILSGIVPALDSASPDLAGGLSQQSRSSTTGRGGSRLRDALVVVQISLAMVLLIAAGLLLRGLYRLYHVDPGFRAEHVIAVELDHSGSGYTSSGVPGPHRPQVFVRRLVERARALPGALSVAAVLKLPIADPTSRPVALLTREQAPLTARAIVMTPSYFQTMGMTLAAGRGFEESDTDEAPLVAVVNQAMARRYWPNTSPIGQQIVFGSPERQERDRFQRVSWRTIVGVVSDIRDLSLTLPPGPQVFVPYFQYYWRETALLIRTAQDPVAFAPAIRSLVHELNPSQPVSKITTMTDVLAGSVARQRLWAMLLGLFAALAVLLGAIGIYGVMACGVTGRTPEIGVRLALGATPARILRGVLARGAALTGIGAAAGLAFALVSARFLEALLYDTRAVEPLIYLAALALLVTAALLACYLPARRASRVDPLEALRAE